jgi:hypothetical protein
MRSIPRTAIAAIAACLTVAAAPDLGPGSLTQAIQPGHMFQMDDGSACTVGFMVLAVPLEESDPLPQEFEAPFFLTVGHCFLSARGQQRWDVGTGPTVYNGLDEELGSTVFAARNWLTGIDVALVRLTVELDQTDPAVCYWGGPTSLATEHAKVGETLMLTGFGGLLRPRTFEATQDQERWTAYRGYRAPGDSGAPVLSGDGQAQGLHALGGLNLPDGSTGSASHLDDMLDLLAEEMGVGFEVRTAPLNDVSWPLDVPAENCGGAVQVP